MSVAQAEALAREWARTVRTRRDIGLSVDTIARRLVSAAQRASDAQARQRKRRAST